MRVAEAEDDESNEKTNGKEANASTGIWRNCSVSVSGAARIIFGLFSLVLIKPVCTSDIG